MGLVGISTRLQIVRSWGCLRFVLPVRLDCEELIGTNVTYLKALLLQHPFLSIDLELGQDLNIHSIFAYRCLQVSTTGLFNHAGIHHRVQHLDCAFCHPFVQPACSLLELESQRPLYE